MYGLIETNYSWYSQFSIPTADKLDKLFTLSNSQMGGKTKHLHNFTLKPSSTVPSINAHLIIQQFILLIQFNWSIIHLLDIINLYL